MLGWVKVLSYDDHDLSRSGLMQVQEEIGTTELQSKGLTNKEICGVLGIAEGTVKGHLAALFEILDVTNRSEVVRAMLDLGLVERED